MKIIKSKTLKIEISDALFEVLLKEAKKQNISISRYVRNLLKEKEE